LGGGRETPKLSRYVIHMIHCISLWYIACDIITVQ
jgi:hypothetical protein